MRDAGGENAGVEGRRRWCYHGTLQPKPSEPALGPRDPFYRILAILCALALVRLWILPAGNSFWLDETLIAWTVRDGFGAIIPHAFISLQSIAFCMVEWLVAQIGTSEICLRLPSLLAACGTVYIYYRIGLEAADRELGLFFAALFTACPSVAPEVPNARPYALTLFFHTAALYWLFAWLRSARLKHGFLWIVCAVAATHGHHLFVSALPVETLFVLWRILARKTQIRFAHLVVCGASGVILLLPALPQALILLNQSELLSFSLRPSWSALLSAILPIPVVAIPAFLALLGWSTGRRPEWSAERPGKDVALFAALLLTAPTLAFFAVSRFTSTRIFEMRYLLPTLPGLVIVWGWLLRGLEKPLRRLSLVAVVTLSIFYVGRLSLIPDYRGEDWRAAVRALPGSGALVVYPGLVETRNLDWLQAPERWDYFTAPVSVYRGGLSRTGTFVLPFEMGSSEQAYVEALIARQLRGQERITLIARGALAGRAWAHWLAERLTAAGFRKESQAGFGTVEVHVFRSTKAARAAAPIAEAK